MKKTILGLAMLITFFSCKKEECTTADFVGTWKVNGKVCVLSDATTLKITDAGNGKIQPLYEGPNITSDFDAWTVTDCGFTGTVKESGLEIDMTITGTLEDNKLTIVNSGKVFGESFNCTETFTK